MVGFSRPNASGAKLCGIVTAPVIRFDDRPQAALVLVGLLDGRIVTAQASSVGSATAGRMLRGHYQSARGGKRRW
jgi:hypothetical protein